MPKGSTKQAMETLLEQPAIQWCPMVEMCCKRAPNHAALCAHFGWYNDNADCQWRQLLEATGSPSALAELLK